MAVNDPAPGPQLLRPVPQCKINGALVYGPISMEVTNNSLYQADRFRVVLPMSIDLSRTTEPPICDWFNYSNVSSLQVELKVGFVAGAQPGQPAAPPTAEGFTSLIIGNVDEIELDPVAETMELRGRDLSSSFIDSKTTEKFNEKTSSQVATILAARHGLKAQVTTTTTKVGTYYAIEYARLTKEDTEWDVLNYLAQKEGFDVFVRGTTLYFQPPEAAQTDPYILQWNPPANGKSKSANFTAIKLLRAVTLARDIVVKVLSYDTNSGTSFTVTAHATNAAKPQPSGQAQEYSFEVQDMDKQHALEYAKRQLEEISRHERVIDVSMPGDLILTPQSLLKLSGTGTAYDQTYFVDQVERRISFLEGFTMTCRAKNHSTQSVVVT